VVRVEAMKVFERFSSVSDRTAPKAFRYGTHRFLAPQQTVARVRRFMAPMGITRIANVTGLDSIGVPVVMVCRPNSRSLAVSQGKGLDLHAARASGLMESIELYHAERITLPLKHGSYEDLRYSHRLVDVRELPRTSTSRFHECLLLLWVEGCDLLLDEPIWVPYETVHANYTLPLATGSGCFPTTSNGLVSGNHVLEAISHGVCEVVERDSTTLWNLLGEREQERTRLELDTVDDPACRDVLSRYDRAGVDVAIWDTTTDIGIPSFLCLITERFEDRLRLLYSGIGMGCHCAREIALLRALTEAAQSRVTYISGSRDDMYRQNYERYRNLDLLRRHRRLMEIGGGQRCFRDIPTWDGETFAEDIGWELDRLRSVGIGRVIVVDLTRPEFGVPVVRVVIPGLEGPQEKIPGYVRGARAQAVLERRA
jgi:YcaO-like protein with predicted kinase domain